MNTIKKEGVVNAQNKVDYIMNYEDGNLDQGDALELFSYLIQSGLAWSLQGSYGRTASDLIQQGLLDQEGNIAQRD